MSVLGIGVDLVENARIEHSLERFGERFLQRIFTAGEIEYSQSMKFPERSAPESEKRWAGRISTCAANRAANRS
jgi:phosphopantetheinyl transferase (holo-ACP synthase)